MPKAFSYFCWVLNQRKVMSETLTKMCAVIWAYVFSRGEGGGGRGVLIKSVIAEQQNVVFIAFLYFISLSHHNLIIRNGGAIILIVVDFGMFSSN